MAKLTKKQKTAIESCREEIGYIIKESSALALSEKWSDSKINIRSIYDSFRIINIVQDKLNNPLL